MKLNEITIGRKFNLGNFEMLEIRISVSPTPEEEFKIFETATEEIIEKLDNEIIKLSQKLKSK